MLVIGEVHLCVCVCVSKRARLWLTGEEMRDDLYVAVYLFLNARGSEAPQLKASSAGQEGRPSLYCQQTWGTTRRRERERHTSCSVLWSALVKASRFCKEREKKSVVQEQGAAYRSKWSVTQWVQFHKVKSLRSLSEKSLSGDVIHVHKSWRNSISTVKAEVGLTSEDFVLDSTLSLISKLRHLCQDLNCMSNLNIWPKKKRNLRKLFKVQGCSYWSRVLFLLRIWEF